MLQRLKITNFALIDDIELFFDRGMSVLTGETGAGKSVIVTALSLALGDRADREQIRHGCSRAVVEATFSVERMSPQYRAEFTEIIVDNTFTVSREILKDGSSKVRVNGSVVTLARLNELTSPLAEIMGQHSSRLLLDEENHLLFLDSFAGVEDLRDEVSGLFTQWDEVRSELRRTRSHRDEIERERELLLFQKQEIEAARIRAGEEAELDQERRILDSSRALMESAARVEAMLGGEEQSILEMLRATQKELGRMAEIDAHLESQLKQLDSIQYELDDLRNSMEKYGASIPDDPARLDEINARLDEIYRLKRKYGGSEETVLKTYEEIVGKLMSRPDTADLISKLERHEEVCRERYTAKALQLSEVRRKAAKYLQRLVVKEMAELAIDHAQFDSEFLYEEQDDGIEIRGQRVKPGHNGLESCHFLFSANPGEPLKSLVKTASGGEISRLLLAIKAAEKRNNRRSHSLLVFDEVDTGIGGQTAVAVGAKLKKLSEASQVIVITHLHQIARQADNHYLAVKTGGRAKRVTITVNRLDRDGIAVELDRMVALPD
ncbi:MAG: DNA repair protein RecN [Candidatus Zixiibacteriota bacterium]